jgi:hypothetical protein
MLHGAAMRENVIRLKDLDRRGREADANRDPSESALIIILPPRDRPPDGQKNRRTA